MTHGEEFGGGKGRSKKKVVKKRNIGYGASMGRNRFPRTRPAV
jgi:hypothetical protein